MEKLTITTVIVVQNGEKYLREAIESICQQSYQTDEIILVDGESIDKTLEIAQSYPNISYVRQSGKGLANARNTGIEAAQGDLIAFLDHDDRWVPDKLKIQINHFLSNPEVQYSYGKVQLFLESGCELRPGFREQLLAEAQHGRTPGTLIARKSLFRQIGKFNPEFTIGCDVEWFTRVKDYQIPAAFIPEVLLYKRLHHANLSNNVARNRQELLAIVQQSLQRQRHQS